MSDPSSLDHSELVHSLGRFRRWVLPSGVMRELIRRGPDVMPALKQQLESVVESKETGLGSAQQEAFFCYHLLGIAPDPTWYDWFGRLFRSGDQIIDECTGTVTENFTRAILAAIADRNDLPAWCQWVDSLFQDDRVNVYAKSQAVDALFNLVGEGLLDDSIAVGWVRKWLDDRKIILQDELSSMIVADLINIGGDDLRELAAECFERKQIDEGYFGIESLEEFSCDRRSDRLGERVEEDRRLLADPVGYLATWHSFAWTTDDLDPQSATSVRLPGSSGYREKQPTANELEEWLAAIDQSSFENYPKTAVENLNWNTECVVEPLADRVRRGIESAKRGESITSNGPWLAALLLARNADDRTVLFSDVELFLDILDLDCQQRYEWFGDSIEGHLIKALSEMLVGRTQPILERALDANRNDLDRAALIGFFPIAVYHKYLSRQECIDILRKLWESLSREEGNPDACTRTPKMAIYDACCLLSLPGNDPLIRQAREADIGNYCLDPKSAEICRKNPEEAVKLIRTGFLAPSDLEKAIEQGGQFDLDSVKKPPPKIGQSYVPAIRPRSIAASNPTIRNDSPRVGRNDPCPCGSGKKYKKCCGRAN